MSVFINDIEYAIGELKNIVELTSEGIQQNVLSFFSKVGLKYYSKFTGSIFDLATESAKKTLLGQAPEKIDSLIFSTSSFHSPPIPYSRVESLKDINNLMDTLNIDAYPYGIFLSDCANVITSIAVGKSLLESEVNSKALVITSDVVGTSESRLVPPGFSIKSDGAASCVLSKEPDENSFEIIDIYQLHNKRMVKRGKQLTFESHSKEFSWCVNRLRKSF